MSPLGGRGRVVSCRWLLGVVLRPFCRFRPLDPVVYFEGLHCHNVSDWGSEFGLFDPSILGG